MLDLDISVCLIHVSFACPVVINFSQGQANGDSEGETGTVDGKGITGTADGKGITGTAVAVSR